MSSYKQRYSKFWPFSFVARGCNQLVCRVMQRKLWEEVSCQHLANMCVLILYHRGRGEHITVCTFYMDAFYAVNVRDPELRALRGVVESKRSLLAFVVPLCNTL